MRKDGRTRIMTIHYTPMELRVPDDPPTPWYQYGMDYNDIPERPVFHELRYKCVGLDTEYKGIAYYMEV